MSFSYMYIIFGISVALLILLLLFFVLVNFRKNKNIQTRDVSLPGDALEDHARISALEHSISSKILLKDWPMRRMNNNYAFIQTVCRVLNDDVMQKQPMPPAAEWLLDNFYIIEEQVKSIRRDFSKKHYSSLPVLDKGPYKGYARIFAIAMELVAHTDGKIELNTLLKYLEAYQSNNILMEREIGIIPTMLKLALIESIRTVSEKIKDTKTQWDLADEIFEKWNKDEEESTEQLIKLLENNTSLEINYSLLEHLFYRLRRSGRSYTNILHRIDENLEKFNESTETIAQKEHNIQAAYTVTIGNCIACLKYISSLDWSEMLEQVSYLERILRQDPDGTYSLMDATSRNHYKSRIEALAQDYGTSELHIARDAIELAEEAKAKLEEGEDGRASHVGYYIMGKGLQELENRRKGKKKLIKRLTDVIINNIGGIYLGFIIAFTLLITLIFAVYSVGLLSENKIIYSFFVGLVVMVPASEVAISIANWLVCKVKRPAFFPRLELKDGIPENMSTMIVMPALLTNEKRVEQLLENMESHYLANREDNLYFALIGAFADSLNGPNADDDANIIRLASEGVKKLNHKYAEAGKDLFYFYNRLRKFSAGDNNWTGWERKRGALMEFNEMLLGSQETSFFFFSNPKFPAAEIKYIITLDADTILPFGMAKK